VKTQGKLTLSIRQLDEYAVKLKKKRKVFLPFPDSSEKSPYPSFYQKSLPILYLLPKPKYKPFLPQESNSSPNDSVLYTHVSQTFAFPNDTPTLHIRTYTPKIWAIFELKQGRKLLDSRYICIDTNGYSLKIPIDSTYQGGVQIYVYTLKNSINHLLSLTAKRPNRLIINKVIFWFVV